MKTRKAFARTIIVALLLSLAACASAPGEASSPGEAATAASSAAATDDGRELIGNTYTTGLPVVKEPEKFRIAVYRYTYDKSAGFNEKYAYAKAAEETGVEIEWLELVHGTEQEKAALMLASDLPDAFLANNMMIDETVLAKNVDSFVNLEENDLLRTYAPNVVAQYEAEIDNVWDTLRFPDGGIYSLMTDFQVSYDNDGEGIQLINTAWLERVGKEMPTTMEEYYDVLVAFRDGDPNQNGVKDEIPLEICQNNWAAKVMNLANPWGIAGETAPDEYAYYKLENGKIVSNINTEAFRDFLTFYHRLASENLIDLEGFTQTEAQFFSKLNEYAVGTFSTWSADAFWEAERAAEYVVLPPISADGYEYVKTGRFQRLKANRTGFTITTACENPAALLRWWDYLSASTEMKYAVRYGEPGTIWEMKDGKPWSIFPEDLSPDFTREHMKYTYGVVGLSPLIMASEAENNDGEKYPASVVRAGMVDVVRDSFGTEFIPLRFVDPEKITERMFIEEEIKTYMELFIAGSIMNGLDDAAWDAHLAQLDALQHDAWIQWYQDFVDGKF